MQKSLAKNSIYNIVYTVANILFPFVTSIYVSRILLPVGVGKVASAQNIASYFVTIAALGLPSYGVREFAKVRENKCESNKLFTELLLLNIVSTTLAVIGFFGLVFINAGFHGEWALYIICTIEEVMDSIHCARQKAVKLLDELEQEFRLIERRRQGLGKPNLLYVKDLYAGLSQSNYWKYENHTSGGMKTELPGVLKSNGSNTEKINKTDNSETDLIYPAELQEEEQYRHYFKEALELEILEQGYPADKAILYEILELLVETVTSRKKFLRICGEEKPKEVVKSRLMKLDSSHIQYILECLKENSTQIRNIKQYLLATLYNAPVTVDSYYSAQIRHEFGWGGRVDKN